MQAVTLAACSHETDTPTTQKPPAARSPRRPLAGATPAATTQTQKGDQAKGREKGRLRREAPKAGPGVLPVQSHGEALAEQDGRDAGRCELARGQSRGFGKLRPHAPSHSAPASADGFHDHRKEIKALALTLRLGVLMAAFESSYLVRAASGSRAESAMAPNRGPLVTAKSQAAGGPARHRGI